MQRMHEPQDDLRSPRRPSRDILEDSEIPRMNLSLHMDERNSTRSQKAHTTSQPSLLSPMHRLTAQTTQPLATPQQSERGERANAERVERICVADIADDGTPVQLLVTLTWCYNSHMHVRCYNSHMHVWCYSSHMHVRCYNSHMHVWCCNSHMHVWCYHSHIDLDEAINTKERKGETTAWKNKAAATTQVELRCSSSVMHMNVGAVTSHAI